MIILNLKVRDCSDSLLHNFKNMDVAVKLESVDSDSTIVPNYPPPVAPLLLFPVVSTPRRSHRIIGRRKRALSSSNDGTADNLEIDLKPLMLESPSPTKRKRSYAAPETYAHLHDLPDILREGLDGALLALAFTPYFLTTTYYSNLVIFCGIKYVA